LVGIALAGCGTSNGTTLPAGSVANNSGGGVVSTTNGIGAAPLGVISSVLIDNGSISNAYTPTSGVGSDAQSTLQALQDPVSAAVLLVPSSPGAPSATGQTSDPGSHNVTVGGNGLTILKLKYGGTLNAGGNCGQNAALCYQYGTAGNSTFFDYSNIIAHFALGLKASGTVTVNSVTSGDTITICVNGPTGCVGYTVQSGDTTASVAAALDRNIDNGSNANVGPGATLAPVYAWVSVSNASQIVIAATAAGTAGNAITLSTAVQSGSPSPVPGPGPNSSVTMAGTGTPACTTSPSSAGPTTTCTGVTLAGGTASGAPGTFSAWAIELVGNGVNAGPGSAAATYDVRLTCTATAVGAAPDTSANRFVCGALPAYGAPNSAAPCGSVGTTTCLTTAYNTPTVEAVFPGALGAFTPINPAMYVELVYTNGTVATTNANAWIDYIYAAQ
jgi:hypothetical protein